MKANIRYVDNPETLKRWNFDEPAIEFSNEEQHTAVPLSKVSGLQIKKMIDDHNLLLIKSLLHTKSSFNQEKRSA